MRQNRLRALIPAVLLLLAASFAAAQAPAPPAEAPVLLCDIQIAATGNKTDKPPAFDEEITRRGLDRVLRSLPFGSFAFAGESCLKIKVGEKIRFDLQDEGRLWVTRGADEGDKLHFDIRQEKGDQEILGMKISIKVNGYQTIVQARGPAERTLVQLLNPRNPQ